MLVVLVAWALLRAATLANASATEIPMTLYTDNSCDDPSTTAANVSLNIDVCVVTPGLGSFVLEPFPCSSGSVITYVFSDTACGNVVEGGVTRGGDGSNNDNCYGLIQGDLAAIMLSCNQDTPGQPSSTTTIDVGPVATGASPSSTSSTATSSSGGGDGSSPSSSSSSGTGSGSGSSSSSSIASGWNSLDFGTRIGIIVALAVGIPPILLGIYTIHLQKKKKERRKAEEEAHGMPMQTYPSPYMHGGGGANGYFHSQTVLVGCT